MSKEFTESLRVGALGEKEFMRYIEKYEHLTARDVSKDVEWQAKDVDFVVTNTNTSKETPVEIKTDTYSKTGNLFVETHSHVKYGTPGYLYKSQAEHIVYYYVNGLDGHEKNVFILDLKKMRTYIDEHPGTFRVRDVNGGRDPHGNLKTARGLLVPVAEAHKLGWVVSTLTWATLPTKNNWRAKV